MGKQKIDRLLAQLTDNHQADIQNAAAIFAVAQGAVNKLAQNQEAAASESFSVEPLQLTKEDLVRRYGNYNACRKAAKKAGITFVRSPRWSQLIAAFNYIEACQTCISSYIEQNPSPNLTGVKITVMLDR